MESGSSLTVAFLWVCYFTQHMLSSDSIFTKPMIYFHVKKHQALCCKIPVLIKQQTFALLGVFTGLLTKVSMCIFIFKAQIFKLAEAVPTSSQKV